MYHYCVMQVTDREPRLADVLHCLWVTYDKHVIMNFSSFYSYGCIVAL